MNRIYGFTTFVLLLILLGALSCADYGDPPTAPVQPIDSVSFSSEIQDTLIARCVCHSAAFASSAGGGMSMGSYSSSDLRNAAGANGSIIIPGNGSGSNFYLKTTATPPFGNRMPQDGLPFLSLETQAAIKNWIDQGALDN
ncbi:MAG TPA: hypothetical protein VHP63_02260 [candidate division Zixibacteria bacterium]|nr:hypothetical protein [candidate division Zixibacteria bacterium]